jgi:FkbM family methyltransferase
LELPYQDPPTAELESPGEHTLERESTSLQLSSQENPKPGSKIMTAFKTGLRLSTERPGHYLKEIQTCWKMAASTGSLVRLIARTEEFHLNNLCGATRNQSTASKKYPVVLGGCRRDFWLRPRAGDWFIFHEIFTDECYRIPSAIVAEAKCIVDLGANIGLTTLYLTQTFPNARYIAVEPSPSNCAILRRNVAWLENRVCVVESAIADHCGEISFTDTEQSWGGHIGETLETPTRRVSCVTIDELFLSQQVEFVDLLKIDIEGAEKLVFSGQPEWLKKVGCIMIELHGGYSLEQFEQDVHAFGFKALPGGSPAGNLVHMAVLA